jgi:3-oxoacyl-[acyl-carrier-protein] synthase-3
MAAGILGIGVYLPEAILTNDDLAARFDVTPEWIFERSGIQQRHVAATDQLCSDLAITASRQALEHAGIRADEIGLIILATATADVVSPATAALVQHALGVPRALCYDISAACSGFMVGVITGCHLVDSGLCEKALVIGAEVLSRVTDPNDLGTAILFADGAGAVVLGKVPEGYGLLASDTGTDGSQFAAASLSDSTRSRFPGIPVEPADGTSYIRMDAYKVFGFAMRVIGDSVRRLLEKQQMTMDEVDLLIPHQANQRIVEAAANRLGFPMEKTVLHMVQCGNTSTASIPIALHAAVSEKRIVDGCRIVLVGFGGGLSWGSCLLRWYSAGGNHNSTKGEIQ